MTAKIYKPSKTATQSGQAKTSRWILENEAEKPREIEPLMGWTSSSDTRTQVKLSFATKEEAIAYAQREGLAYVVVEPHATTRRVMAYSDNFKTNRIGQWTH
ncbi:MAG: ETC complex I subunit [Beijerinckiaceae bacterium]|nr:ETC complex I subunit [Beijerinckiaceae bacterium]